ncbi:MAG: ABC transporter substrate-binding protein [Aggregatilineales bacterium]
MKAFRFTLLALFLLIMPAAARAQDSVTELKFFLTFVPNVQFSPLYVAIENGHFVERGIAIEIEHGDEPVGLDLIALGRYQFGMIGGEQVIAARANGRPVVFVYEWFNRYPVGVVVPADGDIRTPTDLAGRNVGIPGRFGASYTGLIALLAANGMREEDINLEVIGFNAPEVMCLGGVEASVIYINNEPLQIANRALMNDCPAVSAVSVIPVADYANMISNGIVTNERTIAEQPELVRAIVEAFDAGLRDVITNPAEAYLLSARHVETLPMSDDLRAALEEAAAAQRERLASGLVLDADELARERAALLAGLQEQFGRTITAQFEVLLATIPLWEADVLGYTDPEGWALTQEILLAMGYINTPIDLEAAYTNAFVPALAED